MPTNYAHTLRDPSTGAVVFRTNDAELAQRYARALARHTLARALADSRSDGAVAGIMARIIGVTR